jgi:hypothetical protein
MVVLMLSSPATYCNVKGSWVRIRSGLGQKSTTQSVQAGIGMKPLAEFFSVLQRQQAVQGSDARHEQARGIVQDLSIYSGVQR